jgi:hypothetical protein
MSAATVLLGLGEEKEKRKSEVKEGKREAEELMVQ